MASQSPEPVAHEPSDPPRSDADWAAEQAIARVLGALHPDAQYEGSMATAWYHPQPEHRGNPGWLHGGLAATLLDHICARAASHALGERVVTGTLQLRYRQPVPLDAGPYRLRATAAEPRRGTTRVLGAIETDAGAPLVEANALFIIRPS